MTARSAAQLLHRWCSSSVFFAPDGLVDSTVSRAFTRLKPSGARAVGEGALVMTFAGRLHLIAAYASVVFVVAIVLGVFS
jgi:hypothetical protein